MEQTFAVAERLRSAIGAEPMKIGSALLRVTASFGVSSAKPGGMEDGKMLIEAADRALYRAKELGRNRVECSSDAHTSSARVMTVATWQ
jgi:diguanylate cyclase (GGDEF)-like protein